jgi:hypothetical protein
MKKVMLFFVFLSLTIKKIFFICGYAKRNPNWKKTNRINSDKENNPSDEYLTNYKSTTRWQTL